MSIDRRRAVAALVAAGVLWGATVPLSKVALQWLAPGWLTFARFGVAAVVLLAVTPRSAVRAALTPRVLAAGAVGYGGTVILQNAGIARTSVTHAALLIGAVPVLVAVVAAVWNRAVAPPLAWAGFALSLAGVGLITGGQGGGATAVGDLLVLGSLALSATFTVAQGRLLRGKDPMAVTAVQFLGAAAVALPFSAATEGLPGAPASPGAAVAAIVLATAGTVLPFTLFAFGQARVSAEVAGAFLNLEPLVGAVAGAVLFGDPAGPRQFAGGGAIVAGIVLSTLPLVAPRRRAGRAPVAAGPVPAVELAPGPAAAPGREPQASPVRAGTRVASGPAGAGRARERRPARLRPARPSAHSAGLHPGPAAARGRLAPAGRRAADDHGRPPRSARSRAR